MNAVWMKRIGTCAALLIAVFAVTGCENTSSNQVINVRPAHTNLWPDEGSILLTASAATNHQLFLPLEWVVDRPDLGHVRQTAAYTAVYARSEAEGANVITVRDQADSEGVAIINQP